MTDLAEGWKKAESTPHFDNEEVTVWVSHGGLLGVNEMALYLFFKEPDDREPDDMTVIPLSIVQAACDEARVPSQVVRWMTKGEKAELDQGMRRRALATISECISVMCPQCKAEQEGEDTAEHTCAAKPLWELRDRAIETIGDRQGDT